MTSPVYGGAVYDGTTYSATDAGYVGFDAPWHLSGIRIDGLSAGNSLSPVTPGVTRTLDCLFAPQPPRGAGDDDYIQRYKDARAYLVRAPDVLIIDPPGAGVYYREQYQGGLSALARLEPLDPAHDGSYVSGDPPPGRDSVHTGRWIVVTGPAQTTPARLPDAGPVRLTLEATTIGATEDPGPTSSAPVYPTREDALGAAERNGLTQ